MSLPNFERGHRRGSQFVCHMATGVARWDAEQIEAHDRDVCLTCWNCGRHCGCLPQKRRLKRILAPSERVGS